MPTTAVRVILQQLGARRTWLWRLPNSVLARTPGVVRVEVDLVAADGGLHPLLPDLIGEHGPEPPPPEPHRLMADVDAALVQQVLDVAQRQGGTSRTS